MQRKEAMSYCSFLNKITVMNEQKLVEFLKDNLKVEVINDCGGDFTINLRLCGEVISSDSYQAVDSKY